MAESVPENFINVSSECKLTVNINDLSPEVFQIIIDKFSKSNNWRDLVKLRRVGKYWKSNIDAYLASRRSFTYFGSKNKSQFQGIESNEIYSMIKFHPNLRKLVIKNVQMSDHLVTILMSKVQKLDYLNLNGCYNISHWGLNNLVMQISQLKSINVSNCKLDELKMALLIENLPNLESIKAFNPGGKVTWNCLQSLGPQIQDIKIGINHLSPCTAAIQALTTGNGKRALNLCLVMANYHNVEWAQISENMQNLKSIKIGFKSYQSGSMTELSKLQNLETIVLIERSLDAIESVITDNTLRPILKKCSRLRSINIAGTKAHALRITNYFTESLVWLCPKIEQLYLTAANNVNDTCFAYLAVLPNLTVLEFIAMNNITENGVIIFLKNAKSIRNLRLKDCSKITGSIIKAMEEVAKTRTKDRIKLILDGRDIPANRH